MTTPQPTNRPWAALAALVVGFFMIVLDMTIVAVANPAILTHFDADVNQVVWVTSAYLLAFAVPLLLAGRLGDKYGPKNLYLLGMVVFTAASLACGLATSITILITARAIQGIGAALMTPQTMAVITRIFPHNKRSAAMAVWGSVAGLGNLAGPLLGGILVDQLGWEWIFFVNIPIGVAAIILAIRFVPALPTHTRPLDFPGVALSAAGMFLLVFGIQEGHSRDWDTTIWTFICSGLLLLAAFVAHQHRTTREPLLPLELFKDRNFSLSTIAIATIGAAVAAMLIPLYFYLQAVRGMSPTASALIAAPMAVVTLLLAPIVGKYGNKLHPRTLPTAGFLLFTISILLFREVMTPHSPLTAFLAIAALTGAANACIWAPLAATATMTLPLQHAGAGSGVYNAIRQVGSVLGSASISAFMAAQLSIHNLSEDKLGGGVNIDALPDTAKSPFSAALADSMYLPAVFVIVGLVTFIFAANHRQQPTAADQRSPRQPATRHEVP